MAAADELQNQTSISKSSPQNPPDSLQQTLNDPKLSTGASKQFFDNSLSLFSQQVNNLLPTKKTGASGDDKSDTQRSTTTSRSNIRPNLLSKFSSYNHIIRLQASTTDGATRLLSNRTYYPNDWFTMIDSSGGTGGIKKSSITSVPSGNSDTVWFSREYYIDNVTFNSIIGTNNSSRASTVCELEFEITEPFGINFLKELWDFNTNGLGSKNYLDTCYMLSIEWKGYLDDGSVSSLADGNLIKYIPFRIVDMEIQLTANGAVYRIKAVPFDFIAKTQMYGYIPTGFSLQGTTLKELVDDFQRSLNLSIEKAARTNYSNSLATQQRDLPSVKYSVTFVPLTVGKEVIDIADKKLTLPADIDNINKPLSAGLSQSVQDNLAKSLKSFSLLNQTIPKGQTVSFNGREQIIESLTQLIIMSEYITEQIRSFKNDYNAIVNSSIPQAEKSKQIREKFANRQIRWFKILPRIKSIGQWHEYTNSYFKEIEFQIIPYIISDSRNANNFIGGAKPTDDQIVKDYFYFFTGKNTEVLNCDIKFNTMYFNYAQSNLDKLNQASGEKPLGQSASKFTQPQEPSNPYGPTDPLAAGTTHSSTPSTPVRSTSSVGAATPERSKAGQFSSILFSNVELLTVELEIMGDPDLIMQDSIMYDIQEMLQLQSDADYTGSIVLNKDEQFVRLSFKSPNDIDLRTGLLDESNSSIFDGIYRIISISSSFKQGKFTQTLSLAKAITESPVIPVEDRFTLEMPPPIDVPKIPIESLPIKFGLGNLPNLPSPPRE